MLHNPTYTYRSDRARSSAWTLHCIARRLETAYERRSQHRSCSTTNWCEVAVVPITPRAPASQRLWPRPVLIAHAFDFLFRGFNFRGSTVIRENHENWIPRKFPAIRYLLDMPIYGGPDGHSRPDTRQFKHRITETPPR